MKILDIEQRSDEWQAFREGKITSSKAKDYAKPRYISKAELVEFAQSKGYDFKLSITIDNIRSMMSPGHLKEIDYTVTINDSIYKLIAEQIAKPINPNDYADRLGGRSFSMMARGEVLEPEALACIEERLGKTIIPGRLWQSSVNENISCSPDGEIEDDNGNITEAVEIKCLDSWKIVRAHYEQRPPAEYEQQIVQYFIVNEKLETLYFCVYSDVFAAAPDLELQVFELKRSDYEAAIEMALALELNVLKIVDEEVTKLMF